MNNKFEEFLEDPDIHKLAGFLKEHTGEENQCEFKTGWQEFSTISRHILGIANNGKGAIIFGVKQNKSDNTFELVDVQLLDPADVHNKIKKYIPRELNFDTKNFEYPDYYPDKLFAGKKFQAILIENSIYNSPFTSLSDGQDIKKGVIYFRVGTKTEPADYYQIQQIIKYRIESCCNIKKLDQLNHNIWEKSQYQDGITINKKNYVRLNGYYAKLLECDLQIQIAIVILKTSDNDVEQYRFQGSKYLRLDDYVIYVDGMSQDFIKLELRWIPANIR